MDAHECLEDLSRDFVEAEEALEICDPDEPCSVVECMHHLHAILTECLRRVREIQRVQKRTNVCR